MSRAHLSSPPRSRLPRLGLLVGLISGLASGETGSSGEAHPGERSRARREIGELLVVERGCGHCHVLESPGGTSRNLPARSAGDLASRSRLLAEAHLREFIEKSHPGRTVRQVPRTLEPLSNPESDRLSGSLIGFLLGDRDRREAAPLTLPPERVRELVEKGRELYHGVGCVACHLPEPGVRPANLPESAALPAPTNSGVTPGHRTSRFTPAGLRTFLAGSPSHAGVTHEPRIPLEPDEIEALATYLLRELPGDTTSSPPPTARDPGASSGPLDARLSCRACHRPQGEEAKSTRPGSRLEARSLSEKRGCLAASPPPSVPDFGLTDLEREQIVEALTAPLEEGREFGTPVHPEAVRFELELRGCLQCHVRDGEGGPDPGRSAFFGSSLAQADLGDEGRLPPPLTGVGGKLLPHVLESVLRGEDRLRPYLRTRMPDFGPSLAARLGALLKEVDLPRDRVEPERVGRNARGRQLVGSKGLSCITCHALNGQRSTGIPGLDLGRLGDRLHPRWFREFLLSPGAYRPETRMPSFFDVELDEETLVPVGEIPAAVYRDLDSIWVYLLESDHTRLPEGLEKKGSFELRPVDRPLVFRTFIEGAGLHAIAVGHPEGVHLAFDARHCRPALLWTGRFLDAESTWADRFNPPAVPLGEGIVKWPRDVLVLRASPKKGSPPEPPRFRGYRIPPVGHPVFEYQRAGWSVEETFRPRTEKTLSWRITIHGEGVPLALDLRPSRNGDRRARLRLLELTLDGRPASVETPRPAENPRPLDFEERLELELEVSP